MSSLMKKLLLLLLISGTAQAGLLCKSLAVSGERQIIQICGEEISEGTFKNPRLIDSHAIDWPVAPGLSAKLSANKICKKLGMSSVLEYQVGQCSSEQATVNLKGNYAFEFDFKCIELLSCI